jgi:hypothetical protein
MITEFFVGDTRDFDMDINPIQQRAREALLVFGYDTGEAGTLFDRVVVISAGSGIHRSDHRGFVDSRNAMNCFYWTS